MSELESRADIIERQPGALAAATKSFELEAAEVRQRIFRMQQRAKWAAEAAARSHAQAMAELHSADEDDDVDALIEQAEASRALLQEARAYARAVEQEGRKAIARIDQSVARFQDLSGRAGLFVEERLQKYRRYWSVDEDASAASSGSGRASAAVNGTVAAPALAAEAADLPALPHGLVWVPLDALDWSEVADDLEFKHAPRDSMEQMMQTFQRDVLPLLKKGGALDRERLRRLDRAAGLDPDGTPTDPRNRVLAWDCMIGQGKRDDDLVAVSPPLPGETSHRFTSGRHRALVARALGWTHMPVRMLGGGRS
jgi:hypothetical protein